MPVVNAYTSMAAIQARLHGVTSAEQPALEEIATGASRALDQWLGRRFFAVTETRYYGSRDGLCLRLDQDLRSVATLKSDENGDRIYEVTWATTDYYLEPANAVADGRPYTRIDVDAVNGRYSFPRRARAVEVAGSWGFCATGSHPAVIGEATLLLVLRLYKRGDAPLGVAGSQELGFVRISNDRDIQDLVYPYNRRWGVA